MLYHPGLNDLGFPEKRVTGNLILVGLNAGVTAISFGAVLITHESLGAYTA